jgi:hypothetical protein
VAELLEDANGLRNLADDCLPTGYCLALSGALLRAGWFVQHALLLLILWESSDAFPLLILWGSLDALLLLIL